MSTKAHQLYDVFRVFYQTYDEIETYGEQRRKRVAKALPFDAAMKLRDELGFGHSVHDHDPQWKER